MSVTIAAYIALYVLQNLRRPLCVSYISDRVHSRVMSVGLSVESLTKVILMAALAPVCGYFADTFGVGWTILLSGILLKMGSYGLIRATTMLPEAALAMQDVLLALALVAILYGGLLAWRQSDLKRMIAYSSVSHMGVVLLGIATLNVHGITGAVMQMVAHGFVAAALFLLIGLLYERTHTRDINDYSSLVRITPRFAFFTSLAFIAAVGMPGTAGFVAELHALIGGFERWGWLVIGLSLGVLISAAYAVRSVTRLFTGPVRPRMEGISDLKSSELLAASVLTFGFLLLGFIPAPALNLMNASVTQLASLFNGIGG